MKRIHRTLLLAAVLFGGGIGAGIYVLETDVQDANERHRRAEDQKRLFHGFGIVDVTGGVITTHGSTIAFVPDGGGWRITSPVEWAGDRESIDGAIQHMIAVKIEGDSRIERPTEEQLRAWGLDVPRMTLELATAKGTHRLLVGRRNALADMVAIADGARSAAGLTVPDAVFPLDKPADQFRERRLFPAKADAVTTVSRRNRDGTGFVLSRTADGFEVSAPDGASFERASADRAEILISTLTKRLAIGRFLSDAYDEADALAYGLDAPSFSLSVTTKRGERAVDVGRIAETQDREGTAVAHVRGTQTIVEVPKMIQHDLLEDHVALLDRTLVRFDQKSVAKVEIEQGAERLFVERDGDGWMITSPTRAPAKKWKMNDVVRVYSKLEALREHAPAPGPRELEDWLLEPPSRRLVFYDAAGQVLGSVRIGELAGDDELYAKGSGSAAYVIAASKVVVLPKDAQDLVDPEGPK